MLRHTVETASAKHAEKQTQQTEESNGTTGKTAEILSQYLLNWSLQHYCYTNMMNIYGYEEG
jgi:hypothetical protein